MVNNRQMKKISDTEVLKILDTDVHYKFFGKYETGSNKSNKSVMKQLVNISNVYLLFDQAIPRIALATKTFALPTLQYHMWATDWTVIQLKDIDRRTREILRKE